MRDYRFYIKDILAAIEAIEKFVEGIGFDKFKQDDKTSSAVIRKFEIIGEAVKKIPEDIKEKHPQLPWKEMAGMRDKLIHFYFGIDLNIVWQTIKRRFPQIKLIMYQLLENSKD